MSALGLRHELLVEFFVYGIPQAQGSKRVVPGRRYPLEASALTRPWRAAITAEAALAMSGPPISGPVTLEATFYFVRPKGHYGTGRNASRLKASARRHPSGPDLDKLLRAVGDALTGVVLQDDRQIVSLKASREYGERAGARIRVYEKGRS